MKRNFRIPEVVESSLTQPLLKLPSCSRWCSSHRGSLKILPTRLVAGLRSHSLLSRVARRSRYHSVLHLKFCRNGTCACHTPFTCVIISSNNVTFSIDDCTVHSYKEIDGYITQPCEPSDDPTLCSTILSRYMGRAVHLLYKGPRPRPADPTPACPDLEATVDYHDGYPLLVASEESFVGVKTLAKAWCKEQTKEELINWDVDSLVIERFVLVRVPQFMSLTQRNAGIDQISCSRDLASRSQRTSGGAFISHRLRQKTRQRAVPLPSCRNAFVAWCVFYAVFVLQLILLIILDSYRTVSLAISLHCS